MWSATLNINLSPSLFTRLPLLASRGEMLAAILIPFAALLLIAGGLALLIWRFPALRPDRLLRSVRLHKKATPPQGHSSQGQSLQRREPSRFPFHFNIAEWLRDRRIKRLVGATGFKYDPEQDIFYSETDAWQRNYGYCRMYDEATTPLGMVVDCEPICFQYAEKNWLIEFWKGQYDLTCGAEIGVFTNTEESSGSTGYYHGAFYSSASDRDELDLSFTLYRKGHKLFERRDHHWWLTGFVLGLFSEPEQLTMDISVTLKDRAMCIAFTRAMRAVGYIREDYAVQGTTVSFTFSRPHSPQPLTRTPALEWVIQRKNELLCDTYDELTVGCGSVPAKLKVLKKRSPDLYAKAVNIRRNKQLAGIYKRY